MKRNIVWLLVALVLVVTACSGGGSSASEKTALTYVDVFINGADTAKKEKFVTDHVHADAAPLFMMGLAFAGEEEPETKYANAKAVETVKYEEEGGKMEAVLVQADDNREIIVLFLEGKMAFAFTKDETDATYTELRSKFKAAA